MTNFPGEFLKYAPDFRSFCKEIYKNQSISRALKNFITAICSTPESFTQHIMAGIPEDFDNSETAILERAILWRCFNGSGEGPPTLAGGVQILSIFFDKGGKLTNLPYPGNKRHAGHSLPLLGIAVIEMVIEKGYRFSNEPDIHGVTPSIIVAKKGPEIIRAFAAAGGIFSEAPVLINGQEISIFTQAQEYDSKNQAGDRALDVLKEILKEQALRLQLSTPTPEPEDGLDNIEIVIEVPREQISSDDVGIELKLEDTTESAPSIMEDQPLTPIEGFEALGSAQEITVDDNQQQGKVPAEGSLPEVPIDQTMVIPELGDPGSVQESGQPAWEINDTNTASIEPRNLGDKVDEANAQVAQLTAALPIVGEAALLETTAATAPQPSAELQARIAAQIEKATTASDLRSKPWDYALELKPQSKEDAPRENQSEAAKKARRIGIMV